MANRKIEVLVVGDARSLERAFKSAGNAGERFGRTLGKVGLAAGAALVGVGAFAVKAAIDFESSFAGVRKTVDGTEKDLNELSGAFLDLSKRIPVNVNELNRIGEAAGQLGIKRKNIIQFTEVIAKLGVSSNLAGEEGAAMLARFANVTRLPQNKFDRLGATIVALGNAGASTEAEIAEMSLRIAGAGTVVGINQPKILGLANALSSLGIEAESGGSAISTTMILIAKEVAKGGAKLEEFAKVAGVSASEFSRMWKTDAAGALVAFIEGLDRVRESGGNVFATLDKLGLGGIRIRDTLLRAAGAGDLLRKSLDLGEKAWKENIALNKEAEQRFKTTASQMQLLRNNIAAVAIVLGAKLLPAFNTALLAVSDFFRRFGEAEGFRAKLNLVWEGVSGAAMDLFNRVKAAVAAIDWAGVFAEARGIAEGFRAKIESAFDAVDWTVTGEKISAGLGVALQKGGEVTAQLATAISDAIDKVDWSKTGQVIGDGIVDGIASAIGGGGKGGGASVAKALDNLEKRVLFAVLDLGLAVGREMTFGTVRGLASFGVTVSNVVARALQAAARSVVSGAAAFRAGFARLALQSVTALGTGLLQLTAITRQRLAQAALAVYSAAKAFFSAAASIGSAIAGGIISGIGDLASRIASAVGDKVRAGIDAVKARFGISSPSKVTEKELGIPLGEGVIRGWLVSSAALPEKMKEKLQNAIEAGREVITRSRDRFANAWSGLASRVLRAFDAETDRLVAGIDAKFAKLTPSEQALSDIQARRQQEDLTRSVSDAERDLAKAREEGDPERILDAEVRLARAREDVTIAGLERQAAAERAAADTAAEEEKKQLTSRREEMRLFLEDRLKVLGEHFAKEGVKVKGALNSITTLMKRFGVSFAEAGADVGIAFVKGLKASLKQAGGAAGALRNTINAVADAIDVPKLATGGIVRQPTLALVGERGPEAVVPLGRAGGLGSTIVNVYVAGSVQAEQDLARTIRDELARNGVRNDGTGLP